MDLHYFKENVSITQLVETLGYTYNRRKGRHPRQYEHPNGDKVIINQKRHPKMEVYFTRNKYGDEGTVIDFVKNRLPMFNVSYASEWEGVYKVLSEFSGKPNVRQSQVSKKSSIKDQSPSKFNIDDFITKPAALRDLSYLQFDRKLSNETLNTFAPFIQTVQEVGKPFKNIGFPYRIPRHIVPTNKAEIVGYEVVNHGFRGHVKGSQRRGSVWMADLSVAPQLIRNVYVAESAIDAMSFYQLYKHKYAFENAVFISTGGNVLRQQVRNMLDAFPNARIHTLFDNDFSGKMYDIFLASIKANKEVLMQKKEGSVHFEAKGRSFEIPNSEISLTKFERMSGIRSGIKVHKAKGKDFNAMLQDRHREVAPSKRPISR